VYLGIARLACVSRENGVDWGHVSSNGRTMRGDKRKKVLSCLGKEWCAKNSTGATKDWRHHEKIVVKAREQSRIKEYGSRDPARVTNEVIKKQSQMHGDRHIC
jgi:hypothetical protein